MGLVIQQRQGETDEERACDREIKKGRKGKEREKQMPRHRKADGGTERHTQTHIQKVRDVEQRKKSTGTLQQYKHTHTRVYAQPNKDRDPSFHR